MRAIANKRRKFRHLWYGCLLLLWIISGMFVPQNVQADTGEGKVVLGYYSSWNPPEQIDAQKVTHINYAFADVCWEGEHGNPDNEEIPDGELKTWPCKNLQGEEEADIENGSIVLYDPEVDLVELPKVVDLKNQNSDLKTLISVGGWTLSNNLSLVARTEETRKVFAESAVDFVREFNLDGLDLDWEYPVDGGMPNNERDPSDKENHTLVLQAVRDAFDQAEQEDDKEYLVTIAGAATWTYAENNELGKIADIVDYMAIMAYDINGTWSGVTGHNAPLHGDPLETEIRGWTFGVDQTVNVYGDVPKDKLVLGVPFYGHSWAGCNPDDGGGMKIENGAYQSCAAAWEKPGLEGGTVNYDVIKSLINQDGYYYFFDNTAKVPYLYNEQKGEFISYDNVESLGYKMNFIKDQGLKGAMIWDLAGDDKELNLLKTISHGLGVSSEEPAPDPEPIVELQVDDDPVSVTAKSLIKVLEEDQDTGVEVQLPADLPHGTTLKIVEAEKGRDYLTNLESAGPVYTFQFAYSDGELFQSEIGFVLSMPVNENAEAPAIYYFQEDKEAWERIGEEVVEGNITLTIEHMSTYGVFTVVEEDEGTEDEEVEIDEGDNGEGDDEDNDNKDTDGGDGGNNDDKHTGNGNNDDNDRGTTGDETDNGDGSESDDGNINDETDESSTNDIENDEEDNAGNGTSDDGNDSKPLTDGKQLPDTATSLFNYLLLGVIILFVGAGTFFYQHKRKAAADN
ncbi:glycoside hydrolase family 18 protein [Gracilibacillus timonensis]|uniref:glycoside hydrolase family 18 protein n=1 Tax=Gracilibacillus timonensis TaxID=1816696 RepID=UPI0008248B81|nr:glycoside hydrolase family 18 protein [Gracilibacillus timonensis]